jgi:hypothetical protein
MQYISNCGSGTGRAVSIAHGGVTPGLIVSAYLFQLYDDIIQCFDHDIKNQQF